MALHHLLWTKPDSSYFRPPPLHIYVIAVEEKIRVVTWDFQDTTVKPGITKVNKVAIVTDGKTVAKVILYEEFASKLREGHSYMVRGYSLGGQSPPYFLNIGRGTMFFRGSAIHVGEELTNEGLALLNPVSPQVHLSTCNENRGCGRTHTVEGQVVEVAAVKKIMRGRDAIPLRKVVLKQDSSNATLCLWRHDAISEDLQPGSFLRISHLKCGLTDYGLQLHSTGNTTIESVKSFCEGVIVGVMEDEANVGILQLLLNNDEIVEINEALWQPFEAKLKAGPLNVHLELAGSRVKTIKDF